MILSKKRLITRRNLIAAGGTLLAAPMVMRGVAAAQDKILYINTYGGNWSKAETDFFFKPFTERTGIPVRPVLGVNLAKVKATIQAKTYDFDVASIEYPQAQAEGLVEPLDKTALNYDKIHPKMWKGNDALQGVALSTVMVYRKDKYPKGGPKSWADFWDVKRFPGKRALGQRANINLQYALVADGVPLDKVYPLDLDRAFKKLDEIKPHITTYWSTAVQSQTLLRDGEVDIMSIWSAQAAQMLDDGLPIEVIWEGADIAQGGRYVIKGTPRAKHAFNYYETAADPKNLADFCRALAYGSPNPDSLKYMTKEEIQRSPSSPEHLAVSIACDDDWYTPRAPRIKERFDQWMAT